MTRSLATIAFAAAAITSATAFAPSAITTSRAAPRPLMAVADITNESEFDAKISGSGDALVVVDYSTTWCGPCKVIAPKFDELSDAYPDSVFLKVRTFVMKICSNVMVLFYDYSVQVSILHDETSMSRYSTRENLGQLVANII